METQIWAHIKSGERYAVRLDRNGMVMGANGPLHHREIPVVLAGDWDSDADVTEDIQNDAESYRDVTKAAASDA